MFKISNKLKELTHNDLIFLELLFISYTLSSVLFLNQPGLCEDEAYHVEPVLHFLYHTNPTYLSVKIFGQDIFLLLNSWTGPFCSLLFFPFLYFFGINVYVIRLAKIFYGFMNILLLYYVTKQLFGKKIAQIASFLMATLPFYIFSFRQGYLDDGILLTFLLLVLLFFYLFYKNGKVVYLYLGALFSGMGVTAKLNFLWFLIALAVSIIILRIKISLPRKKSMVFALLTFALGLAPFLVFNFAFWEKNNNLVKENQIVTIVSSNLKKTYLGADNFNFSNNIKTNLFQTKVIFNNITAEYNRKYPIAIPNPFYFNFFIFIIISYLLQFAINRNSPNNKKIKLFISMVLLIFALKNYTISMFRVEHFMIIIPLAMVIIANGIMVIFNKFNPIIGCSIIFMISYFNFVSLYDSYRLLHREEIVSMYGSAHPSSAVYSLADYLEKEHIYQPVSVAPRLDRVLQVLSKGRIVAIGAEKQTAEDFFVSPGHEYYIASFDVYNKSYFDRFKDLAQRYNKTIFIDKVFPKKTNQPEIFIFKLQDKSAL